MREKALLRAPFSWFGVWLSPACLYPHRQRRLFDEEASS
jgi:hypothetical protein